MLSLFANLLTFDNKKNEIRYSPHKIEWKKQVATVSLKKGLSPEGFINEKILAKLAASSGKGIVGYVFARFKYIPDDKKNPEIFLACIPNENGKVNTDLYYESHIPASNNISIVESQKKNITKNSQYLRVKGDVLAFCIDVSTYYLEEINLDEYIEFVQMEEDTFTQDKEDKEDKEDNDETSMNDDEEELDCDDDEDIEEDNDEVENELVDYADEIDELEEDAADDTVEKVDDTADREDADDADDIADQEDTDDTEDTDDADDSDDADDALDYDENSGSAMNAAEFDDVLEPPKQCQSTNKRKKNSGSKSIKFTAGLDTSILFNILNKEDTTKLTPESQLHLKRKINITILKLIDLPLKTIQMIEKGIYNYVIEKCYAYSIIPIWENPEFNDMYVSKSKSIYSNLNTKCYVGNKDLLEKIKNGKINPYELAFLEAYKLYPEKWNDIIEEKAKMEKILKESLKESATDLFQCSRCKKRKTIYCEVQTRSSDEPMTKFITCLECGYKWKQY